MRKKYEIAEAADQVLRQHSGKLVLPVDVEAIARSLGVSILRQSPLIVPGEGEISAALIRMEGMIICALNSSHHPHRQRFSIAHELGHLCLHPQKEAWIDVNYRGPRASMGVIPEEREANAFAAELLMPEAALENLARELATAVDSDLPLDPSWPVDRGILQILAEKFDVSEQAMTIRLTNLGWIVA